MGKIYFTYEIIHLDIDVKQIAGEIEYGITFSLNDDCESITFPQYRGLNWLRWQLNGNILVLEVDDQFFNEDSVFEKVWTTFLLNLMDFGKLKLVDVDVSQSFLAARFAPNVFEFKESPILGSILKPYYQSLIKKKEVVSTLVSQSLQIIKEDETYLVDKQLVLSHSISLQKSCCQRGYYIPNVTSFIYDYEFIKKLINESGIRIVMVNFLVCGLGSVFRLKKEFPLLGIWGHRVGYSAIENQVSVQALSQLATSAGIDFIHIGTPKNNSFYNEKQEIIESINKIRQAKVVFTKTTEKTIGDLVSHFSDRAVYMACGSLQNDDGISINYSKAHNWVEKAQG